MPSLGLNKLAELALGKPRINLQDNAQSEQLILAGSSVSATSSPFRVASVLQCVVSDYLLLNSSRIA